MAQVLVGTVEGCLTLSKTGTPVEASGFRV